MNKQDFHNLFFEFRSPHPPLMRTRGTATTPRNQVGQIHQGYHFRLFDAPGLVPPLAPGLMPLDFRQMPLDLSPPSSLDGGGPGGQPLDYY